MASGAARLGGLIFEILVPAGAAGFPGGGEKIWFASSQSLKVNQGESR
jgi:hypothetical protein